jgi:hypothetical protein
MQYTRFVTNDKLWHAMQDSIARGDRVLAAVAYFGTDGAQLLPLKKGDRLVVDMSLGAVRQGVTNPRTILALIRRGVRVFSRGSLHAKFMIVGRTLIASSANASQNSKQILDEAGIITTDSAAVQRALSFFEQLCTEPVGKEYVKRCIDEYRPPRFKAALELSRSSKRARRVVETKLWFVGGLVNVNLSADARASMERLERRAQNKLTRPEQTEIRWIRYSRPPNFLRNMRMGDWIVDCMKEDNSRYVGPPARVLALDEWISPKGTKYKVLMLESPKEGESMTLSQFRRSVRWIDTKLDHPNPRTRPIESIDRADRMLRLWTMNGRIVKGKRG